MVWEDFLTKKKIDGDAFKQHEPELWTQWKGLYEQMHPKSFVAQKLYLINPVRRKYPLAVTDVSSQEVKKAAKPIVKVTQSKVKPKPVTSAKPKMASTKPIFKRPKSDE
ncbi:hypothetical protein FNH22_18175 [Fulvivirga sp. M361]|uniref:hypothetical protein n=1 Tax=Fulvivirga sp. M361 TaxID=2594266 RepID=UPI00117B029A|nr:hypothetical protein [Fulvivirga sp. M361]TRX55559.1 hypothetical protein FNH22_18175 [Fulvivirga sp. M361]